LFETATAQIKDGKIESFSTIRAGTLTAPAALQSDCNSVAAYKLTTRADSPNIPRPTGAWHLWLPATLIGGL
jgi:hypothetical protein